MVDEISSGARISSPSSTGMSVPSCLFATHMPDRAERQTLLFSPWRDGSGPA